jgi:tetratricopeptide (TPR) repeat protein
MWRRALLWFFLSVLWCEGQDLRTRVIQALGSAAAFDAGNYAEVERLLKAKRPADTAAAHELLAVCAGVQFVARDMPEAIRSYSAAAQLGPLSESDKFTYAMALANRGDASDARRLIGELRDLHPRVPLYLYWLGRLDYYDRRYEAAAEELKATVSLDPSSVRAWNSLGLAYDMHGDMSDAAAALQRAVELNRAQTRPSPWPPNDFGSLLLRLGKAAEAEKMLREALRYDPKLAQAHYRLGRSLERQGHDSDAIEEYRKAVAGDTSSADACYALAQLFRKQHREAESAAMFEEFKRRKQREDATTSPPLMH